MPVLGYRSIVAGLIALHELDGAVLGDDRAVSLPSFTVTVREMIDALQRVRRKRKPGAIAIEPDPFFHRICEGWPKAVPHDRALRLGLQRDPTLDAHLENQLEAPLFTDVRPGPSSTPLGETRRS